MNVLKGDWYSDKSRIGLGAGWRCRKCGTWVDVDSPLKCICTEDSGGTESPTVVALRKQLLAANILIEKTLAEKGELADLTIIFAEQHPEVDRVASGKFRGPYAPRLNAALGL